MDGRLLDDVVVVQDEDHPAARGCKALEDADEDELGIEGRGIELRPVLRCVHEACRGRREVPREPDDVVVARVERQLRTPDVLLAQPVGEQGALAEAGGRRDEHQASLGGGVELDPQPRASTVCMLRAWTPSFAPRRGRRMP